MRTTKPTVLVEDIGYYQRRVSNLKAPIMRLCGPDIPAMPFSPPRKIFIC